MRYLLMISSIGVVLGGALFGIADTSTAKSDNAATGRDAALLEWGFDGMMFSRRKDTMFKGMLSIHLLHPAWGAGQRRMQIAMADLRRTVEIEPGVEQSIRLVREGFAYDLRCRTSSETTYCAGEKTRLH